MKREIFGWTITERAGDLIVSGVLFLIGLTSILFSLAMPRGEFSVPGPGFFPTLLGISLCMVSFALGFKSLRQRANTKQVKIGHPHIWSTIIAIIAVAGFFERIGFIPIIALFAFFFLKVLSSLKWMVCILLAIGAAIAGYLFFNLLLGVQLPSGPWF